MSNKLNYFCGTADMINETLRSQMPHDTNLTCFRMLVSEISSTVSFRLMQQPQQPCTAEHHEVEHVKSHVALSETGIA